MRKRIKDERGAIVVEATISFTAFIFLLYIIYSIVDICYIQAKMSIALNSAATDISQYSYLYYKFGIDSVDNAASNAASSSRALAKDTLKGMDKIMTGISDIDSSLSDIENGSSDFESLMTAYDETKGGASDLAANINDYGDALAEDPMGFVKGMGMLALNEGSSAGKSYLAQSMGRAFMKKNLKDSNGGDVDAFLKQYHVKDGLDGLSFAGTEFLVSTDGKSSNALRLTCSYDVKVVNLLNTDITIRFCQSASTDVWGKGVSAKK